jgi:hypothetical protein
MVSQVKTVSILMLVQGVLACLMGLFYAAMGPFMYYTMDQAKQAGGPPSPKEFEMIFFTVMPLYYVGVGLLTLAAGILDMIAGVRCLNFHGRTFAIVALFSNIPCAFTCYCAPTAIGIMVYGLIVFLNEQVRHAFELVAAGEPVRSVVARFTRRSRGDWDDDEEEDEPLN